MATAPTDERTVGATARNRAPSPDRASVGDRWLVLAIATPTAHQQTERRPFDTAADEFAGNPSLEDDQHAIAEVEDLVKIERDQEHAASFIALLNQLPVHEFDGANVEPARRLHRQQHIRFAI